MFLPNFFRVFLKVRWNFCFAVSWDSAKVQTIISQYKWMHPSLTASKRNTLKWRKYKTDRKMMSLGAFRKIKKKIKDSLEVQGSSRSSRGGLHFTNMRLLYIVSGLINQVECKQKSESRNALFLAGHIQNWVWRVRDKPRFQQRDDDGDGDNQSHNRCNWVHSKGSPRHECLT